jgi:fructosamine-3-kinase
MDPAAALVRSLDAMLGGAHTARRLHASGFCATWHAHCRAQALFVKSVPLPEADLLEAEADGLAALAATATVRTPAVRGCWRDEGNGLAVLALEWLELHSADAGFGARLGQALAGLHDAPPAEGGGRFGWRRDNFIGATPQVNRWSDTGGVEGWIEFVGRARLGAMRDRLAARAGTAGLIEAVDAVIEALARFFAPRASLIHGDLWSGNWSVLADGTPVIYDPAVACADAEAELAMMELFGQPPPGFWRAYRERAPVHEGYARRRALYQLYHLLNHALLFGGAYVAQANALARGLVRA